MEEKRPTGHGQQQTPGERAREFVDILVGDWRPSEQRVLQWIRIAVAVGSVLFAVLLILYVIGLLFGITLLNLLKILAIPITVGAAVPLLNWLQKKRELDVENQRAQDEALQAYLDQMGVLILQENSEQSKEADKARKDKARKARTLARARTLTILSRLDGDRKPSIVQFFYESDLITKGRVVLDLSEADLGDANLRGVNLRGADLYRARGVDVRGAGAYLRDTIMPNGDKAAKSPTIEIKRPDGEDEDNNGPS